MQGQVGVVDSWLRHRKSRKSCLSVLEQFRVHAGCDTFEDLLELGDPRREVLAWRGTLSLAPKSLNVYMSLVKSFYRAYDVDVGFLPQVRNRVVNPHKALTLDEIHRMVDFADIRMKALILFLYNSGARITSALGLNYGRINWRGVAPLKVHFYPNETKFEVEYDTFLGAEAVDAFKAYFRWRRSRGETLHPESPLFITKYGTRLSYGGSRSMMKVIIEKAGITLNEKERLMHHSFRGSFHHTLQKAGVNQYIIEKLMGHYAESSTTGRYSLGLSLEDLREAYSLADWSLEVDEARVQHLEDKVIQTERIVGAQAIENRMLKESQDKRIETLEEQLRKTTETLERILDKVLLE